MSKKTKKHKKESRRSEVGSSAPPPASPGLETPVPKMKEKEYQHELRQLHGELVAMQEWVKATGAKICVVFEDRDTAGKGGTIKAITSASVSASSGSWRCPRPPNARSRRCTSSATSRTSPPEAKS